MPDSPGDPRVYFAAERTMLAWLRTGITVMAFGFVVARFGLFLRLLRGPDSTVSSHGLSPFLGAALVAIGVLATAGGALEYRRFVRGLPPADRPSSFSPPFILFLAWAIVVIGIVLGVVLVL